MSRAEVEGGVFIGFSKAEGPSYELSFWLGQPLPQDIADANKSSKSNKSSQLPFAWNVEI